MRNERYDFFHLPEQFHQKHRTCEFLIYQMEDLLLDQTFDGLRTSTIQLEAPLSMEADEHILDFLIRIGKSDQHDEFITSIVLNSLIIDSVQFLQSAMHASLQQRLTVAFSLIRKPFVYNLLTVLRVGLTSDFLEQFNKDADFDTTAVPKENIKELLELSEQVLFTKSITAGDLFEFIFDQTAPSSLINISNKALHPSTTRNRNNLTGIQNLNFMFSTKDDHLSQWDYLYNRLPMLLLYFNEILDFIVITHLKLDDKVYVERVKERAQFFNNGHSAHR